MDSVTSAKTNETSTTNTACTPSDDYVTASEVQSESLTEKNDNQEMDYADDSAEEVEKVEHYLESPEKEHKVEEPEVVMQEPLVPENNKESHAAVCKMQLQSNLEMENTIMEEKIIEVIAYI